MKNLPGPSDILEELADKVIAHMDRLAVTSFESALDEMINFHRFLIDAYTTTDAEGQVFSWAEIGDWRVLHEEWIQQYRRLFERAAEHIGRESDFIDHLAYVPRRLLPRDGRRAAPHVTTGILDISNILVHRLERWLTKHRTYEPAPAQGEQVSARLAGSDKQAYEEVILRFVGAWESTLQVAPYIYGWRQQEAEPDEQWQRYAASWPFLQQHLRNTAYLLAVAVWNEDETGASYYCEALLRWLAGFSHEIEGDDRIIQILVVPDVFNKNWTTAKKEMKRLLREPEWDELDPMSIFSAFLKRTHEDVIFIISGVMFAWYIENRQNSDIAARIVKRLFRGALEDDGRTRIARETGFRPLLLNLVRSFICGARFDREGYGAWLDRTIALLDGMTERRIVPGRVYEPSTRNERDDLLLPWLACLAASLPAEGDDGAVQVITRLTEREDAFPKGDDSLRRLLYELRRAKTALEKNNADYLQRGIRAIQNDSGHAQQIQRLVNIFDQIIAGVEVQRHERLRNRPVDAVKLNAIRERVEQAILTGNGGIEVFRDFRIVREVAVDLPIREYTLGQIEKGYLTEPQMADPPGNFNEAVTQYVQIYAVRHIWQDLGQHPRRTIETPDEASYLAALMSESGRLADAGHTPILLVEGWDNPPWMREWLRSHGNRPAGMQVRRRSDAGTNLYLGTVNDIDVYRIGLNQGESLLIRADLLSAVQYGADASGRIVDVQFQDGEQEGQQGKLVFRFSQRIEWADDNVVVFRYPVASDNDENVGPP